MCTYMYRYAYAYVHRRVYIKKNVQRLVVPRPGPGGVGGGALAGLEVGEGVVDVEGHADGAAGVAAGD